MFDSRPAARRLFALPHAALAIAAALAVLIVVTRAHIQSITIDEADSYLMWAARSSPSHWEASSNNHVLNSALMRLAITVFGPSHLSIRAAALCGAILYIACAYYLVRVITARRALQVPLFVCLVYNPFVLDYLVAARGYSLAVAFLMAAICVWVKTQFSAPAGRPDLRAAAICSGCAALSFCANFSFLFVDAAALISMATYEIVRFRKTGKLSAGHAARIATAYALPAVIIGTSLVLPTVLSWQRREFVHGTRSLAETFRSVAECSLYRPNPFLDSPLIYAALVWIERLLLPALGIAAVLQCIAIWRDKPAVSPRYMGLRLGLMAAAIFALSLGIHRLAYRLTHLLMPKERTALFIVPLLTLLIGCLAAIPPSGRLSRISSGVMTAMLIVTSLYFLGCLRLTYFKEWYWNSDSKQVYELLAYYNHRYDIRDIPVTWKCVAVLNTYREVSGRETLEEFSSVPGKYPPGRAVYVLDMPFDQHVVDENHLKVVYHGALSEIGVAVDPIQVDGRGLSRHPPAGAALFSGGGIGERAPR
jgi:hypothetical protein